MTEVNPSKPVVLYLNSAATAELRRLVEEHVPVGWKLVIPNQDGPLSDLLALCNFIVVADHPVTAATIASSPKLRMIQHQGVGYERIDLEACRSRGIVVALCPQGTTVGVAEHTILLILAVYKKILQVSSIIARGGWPQWELRPASFELCGKQVGLVGFGRIGREVAGRVLAFGAHVSYFDPVVEDDRQNNVTRVHTLMDLLRESDVVSLHVPATSNNRHMIDEVALKYMRNTAILINTARGSLVDERALVEALQKGNIFGAGLDVLEQEPPERDNPLLSCDNVVITPHIAAGTRDAFQAKMKAVFANLVRYTRGEEICNLVPELQNTGREQ